MSERPPVGLVVAAGLSTRMGGFPKPLLHADGDRFVERILAALDAAGVPDRVVVLGHEAGAVRERADLGAATAVVLNEDYDEGMLSSVQAGVGAARGVGAGGLLLWPVDFPFVPAAVVERLLESFDAGADVVQPTVGGERGHPVLFAASTFDALLDAPEDRGARAVVYAEGTDVVEVPVDDRRILVDVDTPAEYWRAVREYA